MWFAGRVYEYVLLAPAATSVNTSSPGASPEM